ncbi:MAG: glycosyltransferase family 4 protein [Thermodesulfovibrio sp.]
MKIAIILDNNVSKVQTTIFEHLKSRDLNLKVFIGERNKNDTSSIILDKIYLTHREELVNALSNPFKTINRLLKNRLKKLDYYFFSLKKALSDYDIVYTQDVSRSLYTISSLKKFYNYKIILRWWETIPYKWLFNERDTIIAKSSLKEVDIFIPASQKAKKSLLLAGIDESKIVHIYPAVDTQKFKPLSSNSIKDYYLEKFRIPKDKIIILFVGRLVSHKSIFTLIWTAKNLEKTLLSKIHFVIVGDGWDKELFKKIIKEMDLQKYFTLTGKIPYDEIQYIYQISDIFVLPSTLKVDIQEQFPYAVLEALSCGKPVIGSDVGGIPEAIGDAGIICPPQGII